MIAHGADLVVFDGVDLDPLEEQLQTSDAAIVDIPPGGDFCRYRLPGCDWVAVGTRPNVNRPRRIFEAYEALGLEQRAPAHGVPHACEPVVFVNPYASHKEKCFSPALLDAVLQCLPAACAGIDVVVPSAPERIPEGDAGFCARGCDDETADEPRGVRSNGRRRGMCRRPRLIIAAHCGDRRDAVDRRVSAGIALQLQRMECPQRAFAVL
jgi:hypothetical protein